MAGIDGIEVGATTAFLAEHVGLEAPCSFDLIAGGRSNLTFKVTDASGRFVVLRRPPVAHVLPTAHDMGREHRIISALWPTPVPVARPLALCADADVTGAPFYVMEFVPGHILRDSARATEELDVAGRANASRSLVDVLGELHSLDVEAIGLGDLGRHEGYINRQLARWHGQFDKSQIDGMPRVVEVDEVFETLSSDVPTQHGVSVVHGDYRLDNTMLADDGSIAALLDWEICTLGDPLADLGLLMVYWAEPGDEITALGSAPTTVEGFSNRAEMTSWYTDKTGRDVSNLDYYVAFGYWKLACILQGVMARYAGGATGGDTSGGVELFSAQVRVLATAASDVSARLQA